MARAELSDPLMVVAQTLNGFNVHSRPLSESLRDAIRVARLTEDYVNLWWLTLESIGLVDDEKAKDLLLMEMVQRFGEDDFNALNIEIMEVYHARREVWSSAQKVGKAKDQVQLHSVAAMEVNIEAVKRASSQAPSGTAERVRLEFLEGQIRHVLERVRTRIHTYLTQTEQRLVFEERNESVFDEHIAIVNQMLDDYAPDVQPMFTAVYDRLVDPKPENLHQAGTTCRRILKAVADYLYPPRAAITDSSGRTRQVGEDQYVNRLLAFAEAHLPATVGEVWKRSLTDLSGRLDALNDLASKGVHAPAFALFEARHCAMQTYLVVGDLLRLKEIPERTDV